MWSDAITFRLVRGASFAEFVEANRDVDARLPRQPGFRSRRITEERGSCVVDVATSQRDPTRVVIEITEEQAVDD